MNLPRLQTLIDLLGTLSPDEFDTSTWVVLPTAHAGGATLSVLPAGAKACPIGWLPKFAPADWCWQAVDGEVYPVLKDSALWSATPGLVLRGNTEDHIAWYVWKQLGEWLEAANVWLLQFMFSRAYYTEHPRPAEVRARALQIAARLEQDANWEKTCPNHPSQIHAYLATQGF